MRDITFGITSFERPTLLSNLVRSIRQRYPLAKIVVADNGRQKAALPDCVQRLDLEFDCGLSRARNALIDTLTTKYMLLLEDDFLFADETTVEPLVDVLETDPEVGVVGGALRSLHGRVAAYALDIDVFRGTMYVHEATHRLKFSRGGLPYRLCDMVWNFALFRKEMLAEHRWDDRLKVGEHCPYFHQVKLAARWRVAACPATRIGHVSHDRPKHYLKYRRRAHDFFHGYLKENGIERYERVLPFHFEDDEQDKPCLVVLGVGHSGTTVLTKMLRGLGWNAADADAEFSESRIIRRLNRYVEQTGRLPLEYAQKVLEKLPQPWVVKDPRFVTTLHEWAPLFQLMDRKPVLVRVRRDRQSMLSSYARRGSPGDVKMRVDQLLGLCAKQYDRWPWQRLTIEYELLAAAVSQFDMGLYDAGMRRPGGELPLPQAQMGKASRRTEAQAARAAKKKLEADSAFAAAANHLHNKHDDGSLQMLEDGSSWLPSDEAPSGGRKKRRKQDGSGLDWLSDEFHGE